jgi:hypothetical protein
LSIKVLLFRWDCSLIQGLFGPESHHNDKVNTRT